MRQAIETKFIGPTNSRGSRVKASAQTGSVTLSWDDALDQDENHERAARALARKYGWSEAVIGGGNAKGNGNCYVIYEKRARKRKAGHRRSR